MLKTRVAGCRVGECQILHLDAFGDSYRDWLLYINYVRFLKERLLQTIRRRASALQDVNKLTEGNHRPDQHTEVNIERNELSQRDFIVKHQIGAISDANRVAQSNDDRG
ncbi:hypothetical protein D3C85_1621170 [compost metagenome]